MIYIDLLDKLYSILRYNKYDFLKRIKFYSALRFLIRNLANFTIPYYFIITRNNRKFRIVASELNKPNVIVSFTSFPTRINKVWIVVETIMRQKTKPDYMILWLSKDQFPSIDNVPKSLTKLQKRGLTIRLVQNNLLSHKKYYYVLNEFPNDIIITLDDDIFYPSDTIKQLLAAYNDNPNKQIIYSRFGYRIEWSNNKLLPYCRWKKVRTPQPPSFANFFGSGGGTLFPPHSLNRDATNIDLALKLCPTADDVFLNAMARLNKTKVCIIDNNFSLLNIWFRNNTVLATTNIEKSANDYQINAISGHYINKLSINIFDQNYK